MSTNPRADSGVDADAWVFLGGVLWDSPWLNDQHLSQALAASSPVLYVEPPRSPLTPLRARGRRRLGEVLAMLRPRLRPAERGVRVLQTLALPKTGSKISQRLSAPFVRAQISWAVRALRAPRVVATVAMGPGGRRYKGAASEAIFVGFVSDWLQAGAAHFQVDRGTLERESAEFWSAADVLCVTSRALEQALRARGFAPHLLAHAFDDSVLPAYGDPMPPMEYRSAKRPIFTTAGRLNRRLDVALLGRLADERPEGSLFLIGPMLERGRIPELATLLRRPNVHHVAARRREELPPYLTHADVLLIPYVADEWNRYSSPMKVWEYLYAGRPMVGHGLPVLEELGRPVAYAARTHDEFMECLAAALGEPAQLADVRRGIAMENTWTARADEMRALVAHHRRSAAA